MNLEERIAEINGVEESFPDQRKDMIRQVVLEAAFDAANNILETHHETEEEYEYLRTKLIERLFTRQLAKTAAALLRVDLANRQETSLATLRRSLLAQGFLPHTCQDQPGLPCPACTKAGVRPHDGPKRTS